MKYIKTTSLLCFMVLSNLLFSQEFAIDKGGKIYSGIGSFTATEKVKSFSIAASFNRFVSKGLFIGFSCELAGQYRRGNKESALGLGPQIGYAIGNSKSKVFPYLATGIRYYNIIDHGSYNGLESSAVDFVGGIGMIIPIKSHLGLIFELVGHSLAFVDKTPPEYVLQFGVGFVGLIY